VNAQIIKKQTIISHGKTVYLPLAPRDPRSLMQGDYMALRQQLEIQIREAITDRKEPTRGKAILKLDKKSIGTFARFDDGEQIAEDEVYIKYRRSKRGYQFGLESFFFEEGMGATYASARFCEIKVDANGSPVLIELLGEDLEELKPMD